MPIPAQPGPPGPSEAARPGGMPASVRLASNAMAVLASLLIVRAAVLWYGYDAAVHEITTRSAGVSRAQAAQWVLIALVPSLVVGLLLALAAWFLLRRRPWARGIGLGASTILGLLTLFSLAAAGGLSLTSALLIVLCAAAVSGLLARSTSGWVPSLGARRRSFLRPGRSPAASRGSGTTRSTA